MKLIPLSIWQTKLRGKYFAKVDDEDYDRLIKYSWSYVNEKGFTYAVNFKGKKSIDPTRNVRMHRFLLGLEFGNELQVDHINHDGLDNQRHNLRKATVSQNGMNKVSLENSSSKYVGVSLAHQKYKNSIYTHWAAYIRLDKKKKHIGVFRTELEAAKARDIAAKKYYGEFANLNFP